MDDEDLDNELENNLLVVTMNEVSNVDKDIPTKSQTNQPDSCEVTCALEWNISTDKFVPMQNLPQDRKCKLHGSILDSSPMQNLLTNEKFKNY